MEYGGRELELNMVNISRTEILKWIATISYVS